MAVKSTIAFRTILKMVFLGAFASLFLTFTVQASGRLQQTGNRPVVVVIDPGHGGDNNGTRENGVLEKSMTLTVAKAMYQELSKFDNIKVYMTRTEDVDMTLKERAEMAAELGADFLFSLHFNASETQRKLSVKLISSLSMEI